MNWSWIKKMSNKNNGIKKSKHKKEKYLCSECHKNYVKNPDMLCTQCYEYYVSEVYYPEENN